MTTDWSQPWRCDDCGCTAADNGVPDRCPACGSGNTVPLGNAVAAIYVPEDGRDDIVLVYLDLHDGGLASLDTYLDGGEPEELDWPVPRPDVQAFVREDGMRSDLPRNNRATRLLAKSLPVGGWVGGPCLIVGQQPDGGLAALPPDVTVAILTSATMTVHDA